MSGSEETEQDEVAVAPSETCPIMRSNIPLPQKLNTKKNLAENWKSWKQVWDSYEIVSHLASQNDKYRVATFITCIGTDALEIYNGLPFESETDKSSMEKILKLMEAYCIGATNVTYERYKFNNRNQLQEEGIDAYVAHLRTLAQTCQFTTLKDDLIRDRIICGIRDNGVRKRLLQERELTLKKCVDMCRAAETTRVQTKVMNSDEVHEVDSKHRNRKDRNSRGRSDNSSRKRNDSTEFVECSFCGRTHERSKKKCPAFGKTCANCGKENHFASKCKSTKNKASGKRAVHRVDEDSSEEDSSEEDSSNDEYCFTVSTVDAKPKQLKVNRVDKKQPKSKIFAKILIEGELVRFQVDSGATCNIIRREHLPKGCEIKPTSHELNMYNGTSMKPLGKCRLKIRNPKNNKRYEVEFVVVNGNCVPLLGARTSQEMNLIKVKVENISVVTDLGVQAVTMKEILAKFPDVFEGEGTMQGKLHLEYDETITPVKQPLRRVPVAMKSQLKEELNRLENLGIIKPVVEPTDWVSSLVVVKKPNGKLRICIDPKPLNKALKRSHYPMPIMDDILPELSQAKVFSVCDVKNGFWHIELDERSSYLTTFGTPFGRFRWRKMPFGISPAPEYFQQRLDQAIENLPGVKTVADDIITYGEGATLEEAIADHDRKIVSLLKRCRDKGIKLNKDKFKLRLTEISYMGHILTGNGLKPDPSKVEAVQKMERPTDVKGVQRLVGLVNYLAKFLPKLADICQPLRELTRKEVAWNWTHEHNASLRGIKEAVTSAPVLKYFNPEEELTLQCDASETGLGAALMQNGQPVAYASRSLTNTERNYAQIEKELLAIVFGVEKFHQYTYGRKVHVESDHKPLEIIYTKPLVSAPKRLQRMLLRLQRYNLEIEYKKGKDMYLADTLSRAYLRNTQDESTIHEVMQVDERSKTERETEQMNMLEYLPITSVKLKEIQKATEDDTTMQFLKQTIKSGWTQECKKYPQEIIPYFHVRDELSVQNGIIFRSNRCVIPKSLRPDILDRIHRSHIGTQGCLRRARDSVYWPGITAEIKCRIAKCETCRMYEVAQQKETLCPHQTPNRPWSKVAADMFELDNRNYLVTVDYYSNFWEVDYLEYTKSTDVIKKLKQHFARYGIPDTMVSDNGPQFVSEEFEKFSSEWEFEHVTSSPGYAQSNGMAESAVKSAKKLLKKAKQSGTDPLLAVLDHRNTPTEAMNSSPAQRLMSRRTKTLLPTHAKLLQPRPVENVKEKLDKARQKQAKNYNKTAKDLPPLSEGETVRVQPVRQKRGPWLKATVQSKLDHRSYEVLTENGGVLRRNRRHLKLTPEPPVEEETPDIRQTPEQREALLKEISTPRDVEKPTSKNSVQSQPMSATKPSAVTTRSGRVVKPPSYLKDYQT